MLVEEPNFSNFELKLTAGNRQFTADPKDDGSQCSLGASI